MVGRRGANSTARRSTNSSKPRTIQYSELCSANQGRAGGAAPGATWASSPPRHAAAPSRAAVQLGGRRPEPRRRTHAGFSAVSLLACCCCRLHLALQPDRAARLWSYRAWPCPPHTPCRLTAASLTRVLLQALAFLPELSPKQPVVNKNQLAVLSMWICGIPC